MTSFKPYKNVKYVYCILSTTIFKTLQYLQKFNFSMKKHNNRIYNSLYEIIN